MARILILVFLGFATSLVIRLGLAESLFRQDTAGAVRQALSVQAGHWGFAGAPSAYYYERLADLDPQHARGALRQAVEVSPRSSSAWIALGLAEEGTENFAAAEQALLEAARVDREYLPAWSLANFYFRRAGQGSFWPWAQRAAARSYDDLGPLLKLCDFLDSENVLANLGDSPRIERAYLDFLIREERLDSAQRVALKILERRVPDDTPRLVDFTDRQIRAGHGQSALEIWNRLARERLIRFLPIDRSHILTNGDLKSAPTGEGFDWRLPAAGGLTAEWRPPSLSLSFSGADLDAGPLMQQFVMLYQPRYRLRFEYLTTAMPASTGIRWTLHSSESDGKETPPLAASDSWRDAEYTLPAVRTGLGRLVLLYRREPGTIRAAGRLEIRKLRLEAL